EFSKVYLSLQLDTRNAATEFEKIEEQDRQATEERAYHAQLNASQYLDDYSMRFGDHQGWETWRLPFDAINSGQSAFTQPVPAALTPHFPVWADKSAFVEQRFLSLLPINHSSYKTSAGLWK